MDGIIGMIKMVLGDTPPASWAFCNGAVLQSADYPELAAMLGNKFGGDGKETFGLPNLAPPPSGNYVMCLEDPKVSDQPFRGFVSQIALFVGQELPEGWMYCDGRVLAADKYPILKAAMGSTYGGDGVTTVGLPNMQAVPGIEYIMCVDGIDPRGENASEEEDDDDY